jgi:hypothetical protein
MRMAVKPQIKKADIKPKTKSSLDGMHGIGNCSGQNALVFSIASGL